MAKLTADVGRAAADRMCVVFGDQLTTNVPAFERLDVGRDVVLMMEVAEEATHVASHRQRTVQFLSSMRHFAMDLVDAGHRVRYVTLDSPQNTQSFTEEVERAAAMYRPGEVVLTHPGEHRVMAMVDMWKRDLEATVEVLPDTHFLATSEDFSSWASGRKQLIMEYFYREQRRRLGVLVSSDGKPKGGTWNYDKENRGSFKTAPRVPQPFRTEPDDVTREVMSLVERRFPDAPGRMSSFGWPVARVDGLDALDRFVDERLSRFGTYQDAM
ncbi:MAG: cryptochrome/photolyase family protein, partial [Planctomycetota bacterium]